MAHAFTTSIYQYNGLGYYEQETNNGVTTNFTMDLNTGLTQVLADGTKTYLYGTSRIGQFTAADSAYFLGDALGSVRQLTDDTGAVTLAKSYEPYGEVLSAAGDGSSAYGYTGEQSDVSGLIYLRARYYASYLNQFIQPDPILPNPYQPQQWNRYSYVGGNPVNHKDPLGLCTDCYLFFFPGAGNDGDIDGNGSVFNNLAIDEQTFLRQLQSETQVKIRVIYPYGSGVRLPSGYNSENAAIVFATAYTGGGNITNSKANEVIESILWGITDLPGSLTKFDPCRKPGPNKASQITFLAYSGGGQMAYATAQKLAGKQFVDKLVMFGSPYRAYNGVNNIGHLWELWGEDDLTNKISILSGVPYAFLDWDTYNVKEKDIYNNGATVCMIPNNGKTETGKDVSGSTFHSDYLVGDNANDPRYSTAISDTGYICVTNGQKKMIPAVDGRKRGRAFIDFLKNEVGVGKP